MNAMVKLIGVLMIITSVLAGCTFEQMEKGAPDELLISYLPEAPSFYEGDSGYYHAVQSLDRSETETDVIVVLKGEVRALTSAKRLTDHLFEVTLKVNSDELTQQTVGDKLNDSDFESLVLLKAPLEVGHSWSFWTKDRQGKHTKVTGIITDMDEATGAMTVRHSTKAGYYEERKIAKKLGVTDFIRPVTFKKESAITGYHRVESEYQTDEPIDARQERILIPSRIYALILGFNQAWSRYVSGIDSEVFDFVMPDSEASKKMTAIIPSEMEAVEFVSFYPYEISFEGGGATVYVLETYTTESEGNVESKVAYTIIDVETVPKIINFISIR